MMPRQTDKIASSRRILIGGVLPSLRLGVAIALVITIASSGGCSKSRSRAHREAHGPGDDSNENRQPVIDENDRRVVIERPQPKQYHITPPPPRTTETNTTSQPPVSPPPPREEGVRVYSVQPKDTLWSLSERFYGHSRHWRKIYSANRNRVPDPRNLAVGTKLIIP